MTDWQREKLLEEARRHERALPGALRKVEAEATRLLLDPTAAPVEASLEGLHSLVGDFSDALTAHAAWRSSHVDPQIRNDESLRLLELSESDLVDRAKRARDHLSDGQTPVRRRLNDLVRRVERLRMDLGELDVRTSQAPPAPPSSHGPRRRPRERRPSFPA